jgi:GDP/UDP-N,N'-diacetylbacillosamine 2-epimerase (hydrolysing)
MKSVCVVTGTRAEYGLLRLLLKEISLSKNINLQLLVTGSHLSENHGFTHREIEADGFPIDWKVNMLDDGNDAVALTKAMGKALAGFADAYAALKPDILVLVGDRYEILMAAVAAMMASIPIAHIHGGEVTEGAIDEAIRHSITKMAHLHFVATEEYKVRVIQLGEDVGRVYLVGGLGVDSIKKISLLSKYELEAKIDFKFGRRNLLVTFHPITLEHESIEFQIDELLAALSTLDDTHIIFTMPNADPQSDLIRNKLYQFAATRANTKVYESLGQLNYLSTIPFVDAVVGNSSSGLLEVPSFKKPTINIGSRQNGRLKASSVIDCSAQRGSIIGALKLAYSSEFRDVVKNTINPYGTGGASKLIAEIIERINVDGLLVKKFNDVSF